MAMAVVYMFSVYLYEYHVFYSNNSNNKKFARDKAAMIIIHVQ